MAIFSERAPSWKQARTPAEQRMNFRLMGYWAALRGDEPFARIAEFNVEAVPGFGQHAFMLDLHDDPEDPLIRFVGQKLAADCGKNMSGLRLSTVPEDSLLSRVAGHFREVLTKREPCEFADEYPGPAKNLILYRGVMLPFTRDGQSIDYIVGAITSKAINDAFPAMEESALVPGEPAAADQVEAPEAPQNEGAKGLIELVESEVGGQTEAPQELDLEPLQNSLRECRNLARKIDAAQSRSRKALYDALERVYAFHLESEADPTAFAALVDAAGLTLQARAPFTPVVKLVFGAGYEKTRLSEYAAALNYAKRQRQSASSFRGFITSYEGGLKGCVKAERALRRAERGEAPDGIEAAKQNLRSAEAMGLVTEQSAGSEEFVLMLGRRTAAQPGVIEVLSVLEEKPALMEGVLRRAARKLGRKARPKSRSRRAERR
jgi:hypothetical protein